jgi:dTMP kinase
VISDGRIGEARPLRFYGHGLPYLGNLEVKGRLIVIEGPDASGRSTQISMLTEKLEAEGHAVVNTGLKRSELISQGIINAKRSLGTGKRTLSLFYAADFADQLENKIIPALRSGYMVLADRYIYTLMARDAVRGMDRKWCHELFGFAVVPDLIFSLEVSPQELVHRVFQRQNTLDFYEAGMDMGIAEEMYDSFIHYQKLIAAEFRRMQARYGMIAVNGERPPLEVEADLEVKILQFLTPRAP